ncbi:MAG: hypothetical protein ACRDB0_08050 [Paraclostridium sp.]
MEKEIKLTDSEIKELLKIAEVYEYQYGLNREQRDLINRFKELKSK